jgi:nitroreductase
MERGISRERKQGVRNMDTIEAIHTRRSIRRYTGKKIGESLVEEVLKAAMQAPSAGNQQPWHYVVIDDRKMLDKISGIHPYAGMAKEAQLAILVCGDIKLQKHEGFWVQDCSASTQNLLLSAHALGLGAVWCGIYPREDRVDEFRKLIGMPLNVMPLSLVVMGFPAEKKEPEDRFRKERVHRNIW